uniref:Uncharacterized protein n=1 Tax=viral metagenome TaxID=1070528 RepID=A0A6H1Z9X6_9ZZZZ
MLEMLDLNRKVTFGMICAYGATAAIFILPKYENQIWDWRDYTAIGSLMLLLWWLLSPRRSAGLEGSDGHESPGKGFAFRLGKSLNRIGRRLSS